MLRRFCAPSSSAASVTASSKATIAAAAAFMQQQQRDIVIFTQQNDVLKNNAKHLDYRSPVWVEEEDLFWAKKLSPLKSEQKSTETVIPRLMEFYNLDVFTSDVQKQVENVEIEPRNQYSFRSKKPFGKQVSAQLWRAAKNHSFNSKWWISTRSVRGYGKEAGNDLKFRTRFPPRRVAVVSRTPARLYNAEQFEDPIKIAQVPLSAYKKAPFGANTQTTLAAEVAEKNYPTGLFFTLGQLEMFGLTDDLIEGAKPVEIKAENRKSQQEAANSNSNKESDANPRYNVYNIEDVVEGGKLVEQLQRFEASAPTYLLSGKPVGNAEVKSQMEATPFTNQYWVSEREAKQHGFKIKEGANGIALPDLKKARAANYNDKREERIILYYSVHQLKDQEKAFSVAGTKSRDTNTNTN